MRSLGVLFLALGTACATFPFGGEQREIATNLSVASDTILRIAMTQLRHHGYDVVRISDTDVITTPQAVPAYIRQVSDGGSEPEQWVIRVSATPMRMLAGSRLRVDAFLVPPEAMQVTDNQVQRSMVPVTSLSHPRLFDEVETVAGWIRDAVARTRR